MTTPSTTIAAMSSAMAIASAIIVMPAYAEGAANVLSAPAQGAQAGTCFVEQCAPLDSREAFEDLFSDIMMIPDGVLKQGDGATNEWLRDHHRHDDNRVNASAQGKAADPVLCIGAVGSMLVGVLVPAAKLLRIKTLIKELGGVVKAAKLLVGAGTAAEKTEAIAMMLGFLVAELVGINGIGRYCFS